MERRKRRWWTRGITWLSALVVLAATISGLFQLAVLAAPGYREQLAERVSAAAGRPVRIGAVQLAWRWLWPQLQLRGVELLPADGGSTPLLRVERLRFGFAAADLLRGELVPAEVDLEGLVLDLERSADGKLQLRGFPPDPQAPDWRARLRQLERFERLRADRVALRLHDLVRPTAAPWQIDRVQADLRLSHDPEPGFELRLDAQAPALIAGRLKARIGMSGALDAPEQWKGRWTLDAANLQPAPDLLAQLPRPLALQLQEAELAASGDWQAGRPGASRAELHADDLKLASPQPLHWQKLALAFAYQPQPDGGGELRWEGPRLTGLRGAWPDSVGGRLRWQRRADGALRLEGGADFLRLDDLAPWVGPLRDPDGRLPAALASARGDLRKLEGRWQSLPGAAPQYALSAGFEGLGYGLAGQPGFNGLSGRLSGDEAGGQLSLRGQRARLVLPKQFAEPVALDRLSAQLHWSREDGGWRLRAPDLVAGLLGAELKGELDLRLPAEGGPHLRLDSRITAADAARLKPLMPLTWGAGLRSWLERALVRARVPEATLKIDGPLADFPYHRKPSGRWSLDLAVADARLDYQRGWPGVDRLRARLQFAGNGLSFAAERGVISGVEVQEASGRIEDFATSPLVIDGRTRGEAGNYYDFLRGSPLATKLAGLVGRTQGEGTVDTTLHLEIPLHSDPSQHVVAEGTVLLDGNRLRVTGIDEPFEQLQGTLRFGSHIVADDLRGQWYGQPVRARIAPGADGSDELRANTRIDYDADAGVAAHYVPAWVLERLDGASDWAFSLPLAGPQSGRLLLTTELRGARSRLPVPLAKDADSAMPLTLRIGSDEAAPLRLQLDVPTRMALALRFARETSGTLAARGIGVRLGGGEAVAPAQDGYAIDGRSERLDIAAWLALIGAGEGSGLPFLGGRFSLAHLQGLGYELPEVAVQIERSGGGDWSAQLGGEHADGRLDWLRAGSGQLLRGRFQRLALQPLPAPPRTGSGAAESEEAARDPAKLPTLDLEVGALRIGGRDFGRLRLSSERVPGGQRLQQLQVAGALVDLEGEGEWRRQQGRSTAHARFTLKSGDLAAGLEGLGFAPTLSGKGDFTADLDWLPSERGLSWTQARGPVRLQVSEGALRSVDPGGTARVLGLLNFYALPRRLTLDFRDVTSRGLNFSSVEGGFALADGDARTRDLVIRSPSLRVEVRGRVGLAARDYDQHVTVYPDVSGLSLGALLLGGASLATGPLLPLMAVIANQVIDKPLGEVTQLDYRLTGGWDNPEIKRIEEPAAAPRAAEATGGRP